MVLSREGYNGVLFTVLFQWLVIGFENIIFSVEEGSGSGAGFAEIPVAVLGTITLGGEVTVRFSTSDLSAIGQCNVI